MSVVSRGPLSPDALRVERARSEHAQAIADLFERADCPCYCRYWDYPGDHRQWQERCANDKAANRKELFDALQTPTPGHQPELLGVVAISSEGTCVGWMRLERPAHMQKLYEGRLYRGLPCFAGSREGILSVACFLVDEPWRHAQVATRLLEQGIHLARETGARAIEAFPRRGENIRDEEHWLGPVSLYEKAGFAVVHEFAPYPVLRRDLHE